MMPFSVTESTFLFCLSAVLSSAVITNAYYQKQQFYPSVVYITKSNASMGVIYVQGLILVVLAGKLVGKIFFGQLRTAEIEHLIERSWYAVTETCLAFTVFRDDLSPKFVALFTLLLFLKCFHWLAEDRVDYMERSPNISVFFHVRVISLLTLLSFLDLSFVYMAYHSTLSKGASVQLVFGFEYAILFAIILNIAMKYILHFFDLYNDNPWEDKAIYLLYTELIMGFLKISLYFIFIFIMMKIHTFPLFAIRPMYLAIRGFKKAFNDVILSRRAIQNMNRFYPDATVQDIENSDNVCIICRETMLGNGTCKKLPCNHIFHISCLRSWFQRQQTCPTCRMDILRVNNAANSTVNNNNIPNNQNNLPNNIANGQVHPGFVSLFPVFQQFQQILQRQQNNRNANAGLNNNNSSNRNNQNAQNPISGSGGDPGRASSSQNNSGRGGPGWIPGSSTSIPATIFPFLQSPPFSMPQIPVGNLLQGFSDDELQYLEGQTRQQLEARIKCLMDVKTLVTAATIRLQQYNCAVLNCKTTESVSTQTEPEMFNSNSSPAAGTTNNQQVPQPRQPVDLYEDEENQELIRQFRLQRFSQQNNNRTSDSLNTNNQPEPPPSGQF